ncbi:MAG: hypothetical protein GPJ54_14135 [Candidatus Heimdallarchaeota archaeon]|nr:hypothetical protein [Candidatus Heimdallarchaeota archaeon]
MREEHFNYVTQIIFYTWWFLISDNLDSEKQINLAKLARSVGHDLNNILTIIAGFADLALLDLNNKTELLFQLQKIRSSVDDATKLTNKLLSYPKK